MNKQGKLYFHDAGGKFNSARHSLTNLIDDSDICVYSLTEKGDAEPSWLIIKVAAAGDMDYYLHSTAAEDDTRTIMMCLWDYSSFSPKSLFREVSDLTYAVAYLNEKKRGMVFYKCEGLRDAQLKASEFFSLNVDPESTDEGTEIYLRDKAFFVEGRTD